MNNLRFIAQGDGDPLADALRAMSMNPDGQAFLAEVAAQEDARKAETIRVARIEARLRMAEEVLGESGVAELDRRLADAGL